MAKFSKCTLRNKEFIKSLSNLSKGKKDSTQLSKLISSASSDQINSITEIALNTLKGNIPYPNKTRDKLKLFKKVIRSLAKPKLSIKKKKQLLLQRGGFLPFLIAPVLTAIATELINKYV